MMEQTIHLIDKFLEAKKVAPRKNYLSVQNISIRRDNRSSVFQHPPSQIEFKGIPLGHKPKMFFACGIKQNVWDKFEHAIQFNIHIKTGLWKPKLIFRQDISPSDVKQGWLEYELDLIKYKHKKISLIFSTSVPEGTSTEYCWSVWGNPYIMHEPDTAPRRRLRTSPAHVILITADALRADFIGAYGNTQIHTPNIDQLANDGVLFNHARAQASSTLGSYASMLTSQHPHTHRINAEWGALAKSLSSLPEHLQANDFDTIMLPSEFELLDPLTGLPGLFEKCLPCIGNPTQDGAITTRLFLDLLDTCNKRTFFWLQYFDTHPPATPPEPYRSMYYEGDPTIKSNRFNYEAVKTIKGAEAMQELEVGLPSFKQGFIDGIFLDKLEATASSFRRRRTSEPDLALHLKNLGPSSYKHMKKTQFADWLDGQVAQLKNGTIPQSLLEWLEDIYPMIREINDEITKWLDGVVDFRYPISQYKGAVSYFDSHLGQIFLNLKNSGLYEQSLIVITSPHGEIFDEHKIYFHHHALTESCLRIPMVIKPPQNNQGFQSGLRIDGVFDMIDLFPSLTDMLSLALPRSIAGQSRTQHIRDGSSIPEHASYAVNNAFTSTSVTRGRYKYLRAEKNHLNSETWIWHKGDTALFDLRDNPVDTIDRKREQPTLAKKMDEQLDMFLKNI